MNWTLEHPDHLTSDAIDSFNSLETTFNINGERITQDPLSEVIKTRMGQTSYYVKRYHQAGKNLRRFIGTSRIKTEWKNLLFFQSIGINTARIIAYGERRILGIFQKGAMVTEEIKQTHDLKSLAENHSPLLKNSQWIAAVSHQIADYTRRLHAHHFVHNDLKWRNILVSQGDNPQVYLIDCPSGMFWPGKLLTPFRNYRIIKDLACLDKVAKYQLRKSQRLAFYKDYCQCQKLTREHKQQLRKILHFFNNRE